MSELDDSIEKAVSAAQAALRNGEIAAALERTQQILNRDDRNQDALYITAVAKRFLSKPEDASAALDRLRDINPRFSRLYQEYGYLHRAAGKPADALRCFREAVSINPTLFASWKAIAELSKAEGALQNAHDAEQRLERLQKLPKLLTSAMSYFADQQYLKAEELCRAHLRQQKNDVEGMRLLAAIAMKFSVYDDAESLLENALVFKPDFDRAREDYIRVLLKRQKLKQAHIEAKKLLSIGEETFSKLATYAHALSAVGDYDEAIAAYRKALEQAPNHAEVLLSLGHAQKTIGHQEDAIKSYRGAYQNRAAYGEAYWSLANLKTYKFLPDEIDQMISHEEEPTISLPDKYHLCFSLGKALQDSGDYNQSFNYYQRGNELKRAESGYDPDQMEAELRAQAAICDPELFEQKSGMGCPAPDPIFIVGLPRAGSTLLEQILSSHSLVDGTKELHEITGLVAKLGGREREKNNSAYPDVLKALSANQLKEFGEKFIQDTRVLRGDAPFFIDKMPNNFRHIGLIHLILPNAKIIDARRHPLSCCFSNFTQLFAEGQEFTYGLDLIGRYYRDYVEVMNHWDRVLPGKILRVHYEAVVEDIESEIRKILVFCQLPFEEACLTFYKSDRAVRTASSEQVRQPIFKGGLDAWRPFEAHLKPLKLALGACLDEYPFVT